MRTTVALLGLAATCVTAVPAAPSKFTLSISSPNNTRINSPSDISINGLRVVTQKQDSVLALMTSVTSSSQKPTQFWFNSKGLLTDTKRNGSWRYAYAYVDSFDLAWQPVAADITFDTPGGSSLWDSSSDYPVWLKWEITSDDFLVPAGNVTGLPWYFCPSDPPRFTDPRKWDGSFGGSLGLGEPVSGCSALKEVKVHRSK